MSSQHCQLSRVPPVHQTYVTRARRRCLLPTVFVVEADLHPPLLRAQQGLSHLGDGQPLGVRTVQEVTRAGLLHDLGTRVPTHVTESVIAEDDGTVLHSGICNDEVATCRKERKKIISYFTEPLF